MLILIWDTIRYECLRAYISLKMKFGSKLLMTDEEIYKSNIGV